MQNDPEAVCPNGPLSVLEPLTYLSSKYKRLVLVSDHEQALQALSDFPDALIMTSDWLSWRHLVSKQKHAVHFESFLKEWPKEGGSPEDHSLESAKWIYVDGQDVTLFRNVSLGKQFNRFAGFFRNAWLRLHHALDQACKYFEPEEIVLLGFNLEFNILDSKTLADLAADVAAEHRINFVAQPNVHKNTGTKYPVSDLNFSRPAARLIPRNVGKATALEAYLVGVKALFRIYEIFRPQKPGVFLFLNWFAVKNLLLQYDGGNIQPVILAESWPKSFRFIVDSLKRGIRQTRLPRVRLSENDKETIREITRHIDGIIPSSPLETAWIGFVQTRLIANGWLDLRAVETKRFEKFLRQSGIARIVVGDAEGATCSMIISVAKAQGIDTDELLNGLFLSGQRNDNRCVDLSGRTPPLARLLSWGRQNERWLEKTGSSLPFVRTGYPALDSLQRMRPSVRPKLDRALLLPVLPSSDDVAGLFSETFHHLVAMARALSEAGFKEIRLKLHPGFIDTKPYFEAIIHSHQIDCSVVTLGALEDQVNWADIIIGPVNSGAHVETLASGKPYYPFQTQPSSLDPELFGGANVYQSVPELINAIAGGEKPDRSTILESMCSVQSIPSASQRVWSVMEETVKLSKTENETHIRE